MPSAFCELNEAGTKIEVHFKFDPLAVAAIKTIPGSKFVPRDKGGPHWTVPLDMTCAEMLRNVFGPDLVLGDAVRAWGTEARATARNLAGLALAADAKLPGLEEVLPDLNEFLRPYQRADAAFMAATSVGNFNQPGLGKTVEVIAAIYEAQLEDGPHLVIAPKTSLETVWEYEFKKWTDMPVVLLSGEHTLDTRTERALVDAALAGGSLVLVTTAAQVRKGLPGSIDTRVKWKTVTVDEFHKTGATNVSGDPNQGTQFGKKLRVIKRERIWFVSGTPMGGKPIKLWGILNHMKPDVFTSKWRWAEQWLEIDDDGYGKKIGDLLRNRVDDFYPAHAQYFVRRLKKEVLSELPDKQYVEVWCSMLPAQRRQYEAMERDAEIRIEEERLKALGILAEYTRLKQFSNAECTLEGGKLIPKASGKLEPLLERLDQDGIRPVNSHDGLSPEGDNVAVVASQSEAFVSWLHEQLNAKGIPAEKITGKVSGKKRADLVRRFQSGVNSPRVIVMTTTAGGTAITLDRADTVHIMDETWDPDDQEQLEDRIHRISRIHQVTCYYYRSKGTVEERIYHAAAHKKMTNDQVLDVQRQQYKEAVGG
jgi:Zierdtviridae DNA helicase